MLAMPLILHLYCARFIVSGIDVVIIPVMKTPAAQTGVREEYIYINNYLERWHNAHMRAFGYNS